MLHAAALHNLHTHPHHTHTTPAKLWTGQKPSIRPLRVWGCTSDSHPFYPSSKASPSPLPPSLTWADIDRLPPRATPSPPLPATSTVSDPPPPASPSSTTLSPPLLPSPSPPPPAPPLSSPPTLAPAPAITPPSTPPPLKTYHRRPPAPTPPSPAPSPDPALAPTPNSPTATPPAPPPSPIVSRTRSHKAPKPLSLSDQTELAAIKTTLGEKLAMKDLGKLTNYSGMEITRDRTARTITLSQKFYINNILTRFKMQEAASMPTPLSLQHQLTAPSIPSPKPCDEPYPELVGSLVYAMMCTQPDLGYPVSLLSRYVAPGRYTRHHLSTAKRDKVVGATCIHCKLPVTANATSIKEHMVGTANKKDRNVAMCKSEYAKQRRATADQELSSTGNGSGASNRASASTVDPPPPARRSRQRDIRDMTDTNAQNRLNDLWAAAVVENDLAFSVSKSKSIQAFVDAAVVYGKVYTLPTPYKVSGPLLDKLKADTEELVRPLKESWKTSGCTLSVDGWTCIKSRGMVCVIAQNDTTPIIFDMVDSKTAKKTGVYLAGLIEGAMKEVGPKHVVQVVMDDKTAANNKTVANNLRSEYPHVVFTNCAAQCLDIMLHDLGNIPAVKCGLGQVHRVVMMVKGSASAVILFHEFFSKLSLVRPGAMRFGTQVIMLGRFLEVKRTLRAMVISEEWEEVAVARTEEGMEVRKLLLDDVFWDCGTAVLRLMTPIYEVLRAVDTRAQVMGQIYGLMLEATVKTTEAAEAAGKWAIIAKRWDAQLHNCLHAMGWLLNPRNQYVEEVKNDPEIRKGADEVIQARGGDVSQRITLATQLAQYHRAEGRLGSDDARWAARTLVEGGRMMDAEWWCLFGGEVQALQEQAVMVLSQPVTSSEVEWY
ncbi:unnamed protein product, partial [Closterium sp. NIES-54]